MAERIKSDRDLGTLRANHGGLEQSMEEVKDHRVVTFLVVFPGFTSYFVIKTSVCIFHLYIWFLFDAIQVWKR